MRLLIVAAEPRELAGILSRSGDLRSPEISVDFGRTAKLGRHIILAIANGAGPKRSALAVRAAAPAFHPETIISTGFCGALDEKLNIGDIVVGTHLIVQGRAYGTPVLYGKVPTHRGLVCSVDRILQTAEEKRQFRKSGACAVEMEAAGVAGEAGSLALPFYCVKAVSDLAGETFANDLNAALRSDGHFDTMLILKGALRHPGVRLPELLRLRRRCARAARALGEFFADCRF